LLCLRLLWRGATYTLPLHVALRISTFVMLQELFQSDPIFGELARHWQLTLGLAIIACVALMPNGLIGVGRQLGRRVSLRRRLRRSEAHTSELQSRENLVCRLPLESK